MPFQQLNTLTVVASSKAKRSRRDAENRRSSRQGAKNAKTYARENAPPDGGCVEKKSPGKDR